ARDSSSEPARLTLSRGDTDRPALRLRDAGARPGPVIGQHPADRAPGATPPPVPRGPSPIAAGLVPFARAARPPRHGVHGSGHGVPGGTYSKGRAPRRRWCREPAARPENRLFQPAAAAGATAPRRRTLAVAASAVAVPPGDRSAGPVVA